MPEGNKEIIDTLLKSLEQRTRDLDATMLNAQKQERDSIFIESEAEANEIAAKRNERVQGTITQINKQTQDLGLQDWENASPDELQKHADLISSAIEILRMRMQIIRELNAGTPVRPLFAVTEEEAAAQRYLSGNQLKSQKKARVVGAVKRPLTADEKLIEKYKAVGMTQEMIDHVMTAKKALG